MKNNKESYISTALTLAIAVFYVILIYYLVNLIFPNHVTGLRQALAINSDTSLYRGTTVILLGMATLIFSYASLRGYQEIFRGLFIGGAISVITGLSMIQQLRGNLYLSVVSVLTWLVFLTTTVMMIIASKEMDADTSQDTKPKQDIEKPSKD